MKKINEAIAEYAEEKRARKEEYLKLVALQTKHLKMGYTGERGYKETVDNKRLQYEDVDAWRQSDLLETLDEVVAKERAKLTTEAQVTADDLAELTLLENLELTEKDLTYYVSKYQKKPLALKKLKQIYQADLRLFPFPKLKEEILKDWEDQAKEAIRYITQLDYTRGAGADLIVDKAVMDANNKFLDEYLTAYNNY
ncbi:hypothetical protein [Streptococcus equinus]|uniref:hypothetical protein n=1 Tax=Streptococcus equinus TaxID=1335 RepID=UPI0008CF9C2E|nr:hypothetical protein [Streptococcus equinus]QBX07962.1 hypothetical protein JavanS205_0006 [Streptococcus satellite phage Javan205]SEK36096.1 hypothetical protein SAMN05216373_0336 [Streptococcus equinus]